MKRFMEKSFTVKFVVLFVIIFFVTAGTSIYIFSAFSREEMKNRIRESLLGSLESFEKDIEAKKSQAFQFAQFISASESLATYPGEAEKMRSLEILMSERARLMDYQVDVISVFPGEEVMDHLLKKGVSGVSATSLIILPRGNERLAIVSVAPVLVSGEVRKIVRVIFPVSRKFLGRQGMEYGADLSFIYGGITVATTTTCETCIACFKEIIGNANNRRVLNRGKRLYFEDVCYPSVHGGVVSGYNLGLDEPVYLFISKDISGDIAAFRRGVFAFGAGVSGYSLMVILVFAFLAHKLTQPVKKLTWMAGEIAGGNPGVTIDVGRKDEIGVLQERLNEMSVKLKENIDELREKKDELQRLNEELKKAHMEVIEWNKKLEMRVREKTQELERMHRKIVEIEKMAAMGKLISGMAHEINNPLAGIIGYCQYALEKLEKTDGEALAGEKEEEIRKYLRTVHDLALRCSKIVSDFSDYSASKLSDMEYLDMRDMIEEVLSLFEKQFNEGGITVERAYSNGTHHVYGSHEGLKRVVENIVLNATEAMPAGGILRVSLRRDQTAILLEISDSGEGIPSEMLGKIFDPFYTTREVGKGTGLGLYVSYNLVKQHGGDIDVRSEVGKGTTFTIRIPTFTGGRY